MANEPQHHPTHLFTLRLWMETLGDGRQECRGKVQHVVSGDALHFRDWATLVAFMSQKLEAPEKQPVQMHPNREEHHGDPT